MMEFIIIPSVIALIFFVGSMDFEDAKEQEKHYCAGVKDGVHPNYKNLDCEELK